MIFRLALRPVMIQIVKAGVDGFALLVGILIQSISLCVHFKFVVVGLILRGY